MPLAGNVVKCRCRGWNTFPLSKRTKYTRTTDDLLIWLTCSLSIALCNSSFLCNWTRYSSLAEFHGWSFSPGPTRSCCTRSISWHGLQLFLPTIRWSIIRISSRQRSSRPTQWRKLWRCTISAELRILVGGRTWFPSCRSWGKGVFRFCLLVT